MGKREGEAERGEFEAKKKRSSGPLFVEFVLFTLFVCSPPMNAALFSLHPRDRLRQLRLQVPAPASQAPPALLFLCRCSIAAIRSRTMASARSLMRLGSGRSLAVSRGVRAFTTTPLQYSQKLSPTEPDVPNMRTAQRPRTSSYTFVLIGIC